MIDSLQRFYNVKDISALLRCSVTKVYLLRDNGTIPMHKNLAGIWVANSEDIERLLENEKYNT